jgi:hypothetical protein
MSPLRGSNAHGTVEVYNNSNPSGLSRIQKGLAELKEFV